ncbi:MAG: hypothetical protein K0R05_3243 [Anaerocolumna sp.]|jgi:hypothetical protein|nr:hypothetical protein [Anaerocolumna sp.]
MKTGKTLELLHKNKTVHIYVSEKENSGVLLATENLIRDLKLVFGCEAVITDLIDNSQIIIGTVGAMEKLSGLISEKKLSLDKIKTTEGTYHWEAYLQEVAEETLYIMGADRRGTIFGIYDLCEQIGVSPWYYWADIPVKRKESFSLPIDYIKADWPSVKYRGIFINDEEELNDWSKLHTPDGTIGPVTYNKLFELLLRLKANYIWPAMHVNYFNENKENGALAERMGVVVGTSHCDMLLRSNQNEWQPWITKKGYTDAIYDYSIEGRNREILKEYWRESVEQNKDYEVSFTMGMRGIHDSGFHTKSIDEDQSLTPEEKKTAKVALLEQVITDQRQILKEVLGEEKGQEALQTFVPYKEVLDLYNQGLEVPEDLTLIWANDNFGHMRRYPNEAEKQRKGGNGLYFHSSYWAAPGTAMSYLFINSIPLAQTGNELRKSYESGIRNIWVLNVGGLKPVEQDMEFFLRYGWEAGRDSEMLRDAGKFTEEWINRNFSGNHGAEAAELYTTFAQVTNVRKIEHMKSGIFSQTGYGDEAGRRLQKLEDIFRRGNAILNSLPEEERIGFFQLFLMKIHASYYTNHEYYYGDRSALSFERGNMQAADSYTALSARMTELKRQMLYFYDKKMSEGKWEGILTPESFPPPATAMYPARKPALKIEGSSLRVDLWNEEEALVFSPYGQTQKWIELGNQGVGEIPYAIRAEEAMNWICISETEGILQTEKRILIDITEPEKYAGKQGRIVVSDLRNGKEISITVRIEEKLLLPEGFSGYIEADGYVSIPADGYQKGVEDKSNGTDTYSSGWTTVPGMGRHEGAAMMAWAKGLASSNETAYAVKELKDNPGLEYNIYLKTSGSFVLEIYRFLTLDSLGQIRFCIGLDDEQPILVESETRDEWTGNWQESVFGNGEKLYVDLPYLSKGAHTLKLYMLDNFVTISKLVLYTGNRKSTNLGPKVSSILGTSSTESGIEAPRIDWNQLDKISREFYHTTAEEVPPLNVLYATRDFFENYVDQIFMKYLDRPQAVLGAKRYELLGKDGSRKDIIAEFGTGRFLEEKGVVAIEAEYALENSDNAYLTAGKEDEKLLWSHLQAETNGRTGLAMHVAAPGLFWEEAETAPGMHYKIQINTPGVYQIWLLLRHYNDKSDSCYFALDGKVQPVTEQYSKGKLHTYNTSQVYYWCSISDLEFTKGEHIFGVLARKSELRIDRIYISSGQELPPVDAEWKDSKRG